MEKKILHNLSEMKQKTNEQEIERTITNMEGKFMNQMKEQQVQVETTLQEQAKVVQALPKCTEDMKRSTKDLKKIIESKADTEAREVNVLLHNISESKSENAEERKGHNLEVFKKVVSSLIGDQEDVKVEKIFRLGKRETAHESQATKPRLMLIKLKEKGHVDMLIRRRIHLKEVGFPNVYLTRDLPPEEREVQKKLREELKNKGKETHKIFRGKVVPRQ